MYDPQSSQSSLGALGGNGPLHLGALGFSLTLCTLSRLVHVRVVRVSVRETLLLARDGSRVTTVLATGGLNFGK